MAKNHNLGNRDVIRDIDNETGLVGEWHREIYEMFEKGMQTRFTVGIEALNNGSYHMLNPQNDKIISYLAANTEESVISIMNLEGIWHDNRAGLKNTEVEIPYIEFGYDSSLPVGVRFYNISNPDDKRAYVVRYQDGKYRLYAQDGQNIKIYARTMMLSTVNPDEKINNIIDKANELLANESAKKYAENKGNDFNAKGIAAASAVALASVAILGKKVGIRNLGSAVKKLNVRI